MASQASKAEQTLPPPFRGQGSYYWRRNRTTFDLVNEIKGEVRFSVVRAAWVLSSPSNQEVLDAAELLLGGPYAEGMEVLADAIIIAGSPAGSRQRTEAEQRAALSAGRFFIENPFLG
jgi:hypothetical protein